jgi:hypothetical protein
MRHNISGETMSKVMKKNRLKMFEGTFEECEEFCRVHGYDRDPRRYSILKDAEIGETIEVEEVVEEEVLEEELAEEKTFMQRLRDGVNG